MSKESADNGHTLPKSQPETYVGRGSTIKYVSVRMPTMPHIGVSVYRAASIYQLHAVIKSCSPFKLDTPFAIVGQGLDRFLNPAGRLSIFKVKASCWFLLQGIGPTRIHTFNVMFHLNTPLHWEVQNLQATSLSLIATRFDTYSACWPWVWGYIGCSECFSLQIRGAVQRLIPAV